MAQSKRFADWHGAIRPQENWIRSLQEMNVQTSMILKQLLKEEQASTTMWETDIVTVWQFSAVVYVCDVLCVSPFLPSLCLCFVTGRSGPGSLGTEGSSSWKRSRAGACHTCSSSAAARCSWLQSAPASLLKQVAELQSTLDRWVRLISTATAFYFWKPLYRKVPSHRLCFGIFFTRSRERGVPREQSHSGGSEFVVVTIHAMHVCTVRNSGGIILGATLLELAHLLFAVNKWTAFLELSVWVLSLPQTWQKTITSIQWLK